MRIDTFNSKQEFITASVEVIEKSFQNGGRFFALAGGKTPIPVYAKLPQSKKIDFSALHIYVVDERYVPVTYADSNLGKLKSALFDKVELGEVCAFDTSLAIEDALAVYEQKLQKIPEGSFDLAVLGIGTDGHVASLFPKSSGLYESKRFVTHTITETLSVRDRLTLTFPAIMKSKQILVLVSGAHKKIVLEELFESPKTIAELPAKALLNHPDVVLYFLES